MSVEETPVVATPETSEVKKAAMAVPETDKPSEATQTIVGGEPTAVPEKETAVVDATNTEAVVEAVPVSEGVLDYKEPGLLKVFKGYQKYFFWFGEEPSKPESLASYVRSGKTEQAHHNAAWAQETGKGVLFFTKREEDKATPAGLIMLSEISKVTKTGDNEFHFKDAGHVQKFQASSSAERDSWIVAIQKGSEEAKAMKESIVGSEGFKNNLTAFKALPAAVAPAAIIPGKKSLDASTATAAAEDTNQDGVVSEEEKKEAAKKAKASSRSRSRGNRKSFFGGLLEKKEKTDEAAELKKEEKAEEKAEQKARKEEIKHEKKEEAAIKKEEAKAAHDAEKAKEAAEAAAVAAVPAVAVAAEKKHEDKKSKRSSVFGGIFAKKTSGAEAEKSEAEAGPVVPAKDDDLPPVSETAPKIEKVVEQKPLDTAAVVAPVDTVETPSAEEEPISKDKPSTPTETETAPKETKQTNSFLGFIKKANKNKSEAKEEKAAEEIAKDPVAAAAVEPTTETAAPTAEEERPVKEQRRTSLLERFGTQKKKFNKASDSDAAPAEVKREKSPLPSKVAGLFRKPSKAVKPADEKPVETEALTNGHSEAAVIPEATETAEIKPTITVPETTDSAIVGDVVPEHLQATTHEALTASTEVKASA